jgi:hypothetical protein
VKIIFPSIIIKGNFLPKPTLTDNKFTQKSKVSFIMLHQPAIAIFRRFRSRCRIFFRWLWTSCFYKWMGWPRKNYFINNLFVSKAGKYFKIIKWKYREITWYYVKKTNGRKINHYRKLLSAQIKRRKLMEGEKQSKSVIDITELCNSR